MHAPNTSHDTPQLPAPSAKIMATRKRTIAPARKREGADTPAPAYFLSLTVENVRCFGSPAQRLDLSDGNDRPKQWTVILGDNGKGKTTLLKSLVAVSPVKSTYGQGEKHNRSFFAVPRFTTKFDYSEWNPIRKSEAELPAEFVGLFAKGAKLVDGEYSIKAEELGLKVFSDGGSFNAIDDEVLIDFVCFGYGASRMMGEASLSGNVKKLTFASLLNDNAPLLNAEEWLLQADYAASKPSSVSKYAKEQRNKIEEVLLRVLPEIEGIRFGSLEEKQLKPKVEFKTPYGWVRLQELSLGYKTLIAWMVDFASRMFDRYPDSPNPLAEPAVCLVDEIDLHLHPTWQRKLIGYLTDLFPNTQFIVTAHSPLVVQAASNANIVVLRREGDHVVIDNSIESLKGWSVDQILTSDLYGVASERPPEYDDVLAERQQLLSKSELTTGDKRRLRSLEAKIEELPIGETPQDIAAFDLVRRFATDLERRGVTTETFTGDEKTKTEAKQNTKRTPRAKQSADAKQKSSRKSAKR